IGVLERHGKFSCEAPGLGDYRFDRGHPHTGQAANLWLVPHLGQSVGGLPPDVFRPLQAALMRAKFFALRLPVHSGRFGLP
ncbi:hypothetical protein, partial [Bilophila wadsworthia]|uniref:hypothetical protein n=1 Tax=Bilophila wadsworthia TaxID=35833 RepID=UPI00242EEDEC